MNRDQLFTDQISAYPQLAGFTAEVNDQPDGSTTAKLFRPDGSMHPLTAGAMLGATVSIEQFAQFAVRQVATDVGG